MKIKPKKCKECGEPFTPTQSTVQMVCSQRCALAYVRKQNEKKAKADWAKEKKVLKEKLKTLGQYEIEAKKSFQLFIRLRDKDLPCISCGSNESTLVDGGHFFKAELYSGLIFDERNCHSQCRRCNRYLGGNEIEYRLGLVKRYGEEFVKKLEEDSITRRVYKFTKNELIAKKLQYDIKVKELQK